MSQEERKTEIPELDGKEKLSASEYQDLIEFKKRLDSGEKLDISEKKKKDFLDSLDSEYKNYEKQHGKNDAQKQLGWLINGIKEKLSSLKDSLSGKDKSEEKIRNLIEEEGGLENFKNEIKNNSEKLKEFQIYAQSKGLYDGKIDGIWGPKSNGAFEQFEEKYTEKESGENKKGEIISKIEGKSPSEMLSFFQESDVSFENFDKSDSKKIFNVLQDTKVDGIQKFSDFLQITMFLDNKKLDFPNNSLGSLDVQKAEELKNIILDKNIKLENKQAFLNQLSDLVDELDSLEGDFSKDLDKLKKDIQKELKDLEESIARGEEIGGEKMMKEYENYTYLVSKEVVNISEPEVQEKQIGEAKQKVFSFSDTKIPFDIKITGTDKEREDIGYKMDIENKDKNIYLSSYEVNNRGDYSIYYFNEKTNKVGNLNLDFSSRSLKFNNTFLIEENADEISGDFSNNPQKSLEEMKDFLHGGWFSKNSVEEKYVYNIKGEQVGVYEEITDKIYEEIGDDVDEDLLKLAIGEQIRQDSNNIEKYMGKIELGGWFNGSFVGKIIKDGIDVQGVKENYKKFERMNVSPEVIRDAIKDGQQFENLETNNMQDIVAWISDIDSDGTVGNYAEIFGEGQVKTVLTSAIENTSEEEVLGKILNIAKLGEPESGYIQDKDKITKEEFIQEVKENTFLKQSFWKGLNRLSYLSGLTEYFNDNKNISELAQEQMSSKKQNMEKLLKLQFGEDFERKEFDNKIENKAQELYKELPEDVKENLSQEDWTEKIKLAGYNVLLVSKLTLDANNNPKNFDITGGGAGLNFDVDSFIDNISLNYGNVDGQQAIGVSLGKDLFSKVDGKNRFRSYLGLGGDITNGLFVPVLGASFSRDLEDTELKEWKDKKSVFSIGGFIGYAGSLFGGGGLGFERSKMKEINGKIDMFKEKGEEIFQQLIDSPDISNEDVVKNLNVNKENGNFLEKVTDSIRVLQSTFGLESLSTEKQKQMRKDIIMPGLEKEYKRVLLESNEGWSWTGVGVAFAGLPMIGAKFENVQVEYSSKNIDETTGERLDMLKGASFKNPERIENVNDLDSYFEEDFISIEKQGNKDFIVIDTSKFDKNDDSCLVGIDPSLNAQRNKDKIYIGGNLAKVGGITRGEVNLPNGHYSILSIGNAGIQGENVYNSVRLKDGEFLNSAEWENQDVPEKGLSFGLEKTAKEIFEKQNDILEELEENGVMKEIDNSITSDLWQRKIKENPDIYKNLVEGIRDGGYSNVLDSIILTKILNDSEIQDLRTIIQNNRGDIKDAFVAKRVLSNLFGDSNLESKIAENDLESKKHEVREKINNFESSLAKEGIKVTESHYILSEEIQNKLGYKGSYIAKGNELFLSTTLSKMQKPDLAREAKSIYTLRMDLEEFDNINLFDQWKYNRAGGFLRTFRDWYNGEKSGDKLPISSKQKLDELLKEGLEETPEGLEQEFADDMNNLIAAREKYLNRMEGEKSFVSAYSNDIIGFPFTYKVDVEGEEGPVPMYGASSVVDVDGNGKIDQNDYLKMEVSENMRGKVFDMLPGNIKESLISVFNKGWNFDLNNKEELLKAENKLKDKFVKKDGINYDVIYYKWGECFNDALGIVDFVLEGKNVLVGNDGSLMIGNEVVNSSKNLNVGFATDVEKEESKKPSRKSSEPTTKPTSEPTPPPAPPSDLPDESSNNF